MHFTTVRFPPLTGNTVAPPLSIQAVHVFTCIYIFQSCPLPLPLFMPTLYRSFSLSSSREPTRGALQRCYLGLSEVDPVGERGSRWMIDVRQAFLSPPDVDGDHGERSEPCTSLDTVRDAIPRLDVSITGQYKQSPTNLGQVPVSPPFMREKRASVSLILSQGIRTFRRCMGKEFDLELPNNDKHTHETRTYHT